MKTRPLVPSLALLLSAFLLDAQTALPLCYATPQSTVSEYWLRMVEHRHLDALDCFVGAAPDHAAGMLRLPDLVELRCRDFRVAWRGAGVADVQYDVEFRVAMTDSLTRFPTADRLRFTAHGWKIDRPLLVASSAR